jgi:hypothetical protein
MAGWWDELVTGLGEFTSNPDRMSATLGTMGAAISPEGSWQQGLGNAASKMGRSNIKAKAAQSSAEARRQQINDLIKALAGEGSGAFSDGKVEGPTSLKVDGNKAVLETNIGGSGPVANDTSPGAGGGASVEPRTGLDLTNIIPF